MPMSVSFLRESLRCLVGKAVGLEVAFSPTEVAGDIFARLASLGSLVVISVFIIPSLSLIMIFSFVIIIVYFLVSRMMFRLRALVTFIIFVLTFGFGVPVTRSH